MRLKDKVAVITGGGSGIGRAASILFSREGAKILLSDNKKDIGLDTVREIRESGGEASFAEADVSRPDQVTNM
ncbi:MAG: SDR family NAD(P)-dependent oxidoreductase, partial [Spirochaetes bacterium]|nr:SDR family NAD(P)-dependent oxidoreductase [Spirochaetota bacterium]